MMAMHARGHVMRHQPAGRRRQLLPGKSVVVLNCETTAEKGGIGSLLEETLWVTTLTCRKLFTKKTKHSRAAHS